MRLGFCVSSDFGAGPHLTFAHDDETVVVTRAGTHGARSLHMPSNPHVVVPMSLRHRLGETATEGIVDMFAAHQQFQTDRFERRLSEEIGGLRLEMHQGFAAIRQEIAQGEARQLRWILTFLVAQMGVLAAWMQLYR